MKLKHICLIACLLVSGLATAGTAAAQGTIKVGILHSLSGTMAISETTLKDTILMMIDEQNKKGGLLGRKLEAVVVDPASDWPLFAEKARELLEKGKVAVVFGCWTRVASIKRFGSAGKKSAVVSTINGDANVPIYKELGNQKISAEDIPVVAFSVGEEELSGLDAKPLVGHLAAWNYFESINTPTNKDFIAKWKTYIKKPNRTTNDPMEAHSIGFNLWAQAVTKAKSTDVEKVLAVLPGLETPNLTGGMAKLLPNHHITKTVFLGQHRADGQFDVVWKSMGTVPGDAWSDYLPVSKDTEADWVTLKCGNYNSKTKACSGQNYK